MKTSGACFNKDQSLHRGCLFAILKGRFNMAPTDGPMKGRSNHE